jgi:hypothetical protein
MTNFFYNNSFCDINKTPVVDRRPTWLPNIRRILCAYPKLALFCKAEFGSGRNHSGSRLMADGCLQFCEETWLHHFKCISSFGILLVAQLSEQLALFVVYLRCLLRLAKTSCISAAVCKSASGPAIGSASLIHLIYAAFCIVLWPIFRERLATPAVERQLFAILVAQLREPLAKSSCFSAAVCNSTSGPAERAACSYLSAAVCDSASGPARRAACLPRQLFVLHQQARCNHLTAVCTLCPKYYHFREDKICMHFFQKNLVIVIKLTWH